MSNTPTRPPEVWYVQHCPQCEMVIRSSKEYNKARALAMHLNKYHRDALAPEPVAPYKVIAIVAVHFSGSRKRLGRTFDGLKSATVPSDFPGETGVAVVRGDGGVVIYACFRAGETAWQMVDEKEIG